MTYSVGGLIQATDYNGFVSTTVGANVNATWGTGTSSAGYGQGDLATVSVSGTVTAAQWASLVNTIAAMANHQGTTITARTAPTAGTLISVLSAVNTDITNCYNNRGNAAASGSQYTAWTGSNSKTAATSGASWTITFANTVTFASANAARYFFNAGGRIKLDVSKTATGQTGDPEWNDLANTLCGDIFFTGGAYSQTIAGTVYTGTTKIGGTGTPNTLSTGTGYFDLTPGGASVIIYKQFADTAPYTANFIQHSVQLSADSTQLFFTTTWSASDGDPISGGTASSGATPGTAPTTICTYFPPSTTYLSASWGTPTVSAAVTPPKRLFGAFTFLYFSCKITRWILKPLLLTHEHVLITLLQNAFSKKNTKPKCCLPIAAACGVLAQN